MAVPVVAGVLGTMAAWFIKYLVGYAIARVVVAFGISFVTYMGIDAIADQIASHIQTNVGGFGGQFAALASALGIFSAINIITSAYLGALAVRQVLGAFKTIRFAASGGNS